MRSAYVIASIIFLAWASFWGAVLFTIVHFIGKFW
jgi:hypothetical protein